MTENTIITVTLKKDHFDSQATVQVVAKTMATRYHLTTSYQQQETGAIWSFTGTIANLRKAEIIK